MAYRNWHQSAPADDVGLPDLDQRLKAWFADLSERQRAVIHWRYGLADGQDLTLAEIGERLNLTRERVRQIQETAMQRLQRPSCLRQVHVLLARLDHLIAGAGGVMSEAELCGALAGFAETGEFNTRGALRVLLGIGAQLIQDKNTLVWCTPEVSRLVPLAVSEVIATLKEARAPIAEDGLLSRLRQTRLYQAHRDKLTDQFVLACIRADDRIVRREDGAYGLASWQGRHVCDVVAALRQLAAPAHYLAIASRVNAALPSDRQVTAHSVHAHLYRRPAVFVRTGPGIYGLAE